MNVCTSALLVCGQWVFLFALIHLVTLTSLLPRPVSAAAAFWWFSRRMEEAEPGRGSRAAPCDPGWVANCGWGRNRRRNEKRRRRRGKEEKQKRRSIKSAYAGRERDRRPERAPDAVWEGYLIDDITPLSPFSSLPLVLPLFDTHIRKRAHILAPAHHICPVTFLSLHDTPPMLSPRAILSTSASPESCQAWRSC